MRRAKLGLLMFVAGCFCLGAKCELPEDWPEIGGDDDQPVENGCIIEVDHQVSYSPFYPQSMQNGTQFVRSRFPGECNLKFEISSTSLPDDSVSMKDNEFIDYVMDNMERDDKDYNKYTHYVVGIKHLYGVYPQTGKNYRYHPGVSFRGEYRGKPFNFSFVCVEVCAAYDPGNATLGATVHELGHSVGSLTHYCLDSDSSMINSAYHDPGDLSCIMGNSFEPWCGEPTLPNIHFCYKCMNNLKKVKR